MATNENILTPPPDDVSIDAEQFSHPRRGVPSEVYPYRDEDGKLLWVTVRYDADESLGQTQAAVLPWMWRSDVWTFDGPADPRTLYGLEQLARFPGTTRVLVVGDEHAAEIARGVFRQPILSWSRGSFAVKLSNWTPLAGREVVIWPTNTVDGHMACAELSRLLLAQNCRVQTVEVGGKPDGWSISQAIEVDGMDTAAIKQWGVKNLRDAALPPEPPDSPKEPLTRKAVSRQANKRTRAQGAAGGSQIELWDRMGLARKGNGMPYASVDNALRIIQHDKPEIVYDSFLNKIMVKDGGRWTRVRDEHLLDKTLDIQRRVGIQEIGKYAVTDAVNIFGHAHTTNSLQDWLHGLVWDGTPRVEKFLAEGFGVPANEYSCAVSRCFLVGMIARAMRPGCKVDSLPIFEGPQGIGKSRALEALAGEFYADIDSSMGTVQFYEQIQGKWLVELSELSAMRPSEVEKVKSGISRTVDVYREPFAIVASDHPRQCVFAGTTNAHQYLMDDTGNRRFWPVTCGTIRVEWIRDNREQILAEARCRFDAGRSWYDVPLKAASEHAAQREFQDGIADKVTDYCASRLFADVSITEMLEHWEIPKSQWSMPLQKRVASALRSTGRRPVKSNGRMMWRPADAPAGEPVSATLARARKL